MRAFHPPFYLLSHWRTPLSIPTFGFCRAKNESYMKRFGKRWGGAGGEEKNLSSKGFFFSPCNKSIIFYNIAFLFICRLRRRVYTEIQGRESVLRGGCPRRRGLVLCSCIWYFLCRGRRQFHGWEIELRPWQSGRLFQSGYRQLKNSDKTTLKNRHHCRSRR